MQMSANLFCKGSGSKYLWAMQSLSYILIFFFYNPLKIQKPFIVCGLQKQKRKQKPGSSHGDLACSLAMSTNTSDGQCPVLTLLDLYVLFDLHIDHTVLLFKDFSSLGFQGITLILLELLSLHRSFLFYLVFSVSSSIS